MKSLKITAVLVAAFLAASILSACDTTNSSENGSVSQLPSSTEDTPSAAESGGEISTSSASAVEISESDMFTSRDQDPNYDESNAVAITCSGSEFKVNGTGAAAKDGVLTISAEGVYVLNGSIDDGRIVVEAADSAKVQLVLNGLTLKSSDHAPLFVKSADKVFITLKSGTENTITDGSSYTALGDDESNVDSAIFSRSDLTINGGGTLTVEGNFAHAIVSKDDLVITGGTINAASVTSAICGKDSVRIADGNINITSGADGIKSDNTENSEKGFVYISGGDISITAETDGIQSELYTVIEGASITLKTGGGSENSSQNQGDDDMRGWGKWGDFDQTDTTTEEDSTSAKGIKSAGDIIIDGATVTADTSDDSIHSNSNITVNSGTFTLSSGDDGIHADTATTINGGNITISKSYEGIEGSSVTITGGTIDITSSDDGINAAGGNDLSAMGGRPGENSFTENADIYIKITGGEINVNASGDGIDSNSNIIIEGGTVYVDGPSDSANGALDYENTATVSGGTVVAVGSSGMAQGFSDNSEQCSIMYNFSQNHSSGDEVTLTSSDGKELVSYTPSKSFNSVVISAADITEGVTYTLTVGDESVEIEMTSTVYSNSTFGGGFGEAPGGKPKGDLGGTPDGDPGRAQEGMPDGGPGGMGGF